MRSICATVILLACPFASAQISGTGGQGVGDRVPGGARCGGDGGASFRPPRYPGPADSVPTAPAAATPIVPGAGTEARPPSASTPAPTATIYRPAVITPFSRPWDDPSSWRHWWKLNREPFLGLKRIATRADVVTGSDDFFLGHGHTADEAEIRLVSDAEFFDQAAPVLTGILEDERESALHAIALVALAEGGAGRPGADALVPHILPHLASGRAEVAESATAALGILGEPSAASFLIELLHCQTARLADELHLNFGAHVGGRQRAFAAYALGMIAEHADGYWQMRIVNELASAVMNDRHGSHELRAAAVVALGLAPLPVAELVHQGRDTLILSRQDQLRWLLGALDEPSFDSRVRAQVPIGLARLLRGVPEEFGLREPVVRRVAFLAQDSSGEEIPVRRSCVQALGWLVDADAGGLDAEVRELLIDAGREASDQGVRRFAWIALARVGGRSGQGSAPFAGAAEARAALMRELASGGTPVRPWAAIGLGLLERSLLESGLSLSQGGADARAALARALSDARTLEEVGAIAIGIGLARDSGAGELLRREFEHRRDPETRGDIGLALGMVGDRGAIELLRSAREESVEQPELLLHLAMGLALIGDKSIGARLEELLAQAGNSLSATNLLAALGRVGASHTVKHLLAAAGDRERTNAWRSGAVAALGRVTELALEPWSTRFSVGCAYLSGVETLTTVPRGYGVLDLRP